MTALQRFPINLIRFSLAKQTNELKTTDLLSFPSKRVSSDVESCLDPCFATMTKDVTKATKKQILKGSPKGEGGFPSNRRGLKISYPLAGPGSFSSPRDRRWFLPSASRMVRIDISWG